MNFVGKGQDASKTTTMPGFTAEMSLYGVIGSTNAYETQGFNFALISARSPLIVPQKVAKSEHYDDNHLEFTEEEIKDNYRISWSCHKGNGFGEHGYCILDLIPKDKYQAYQFSPEHYMLI